MRKDRQHARPIIWGARPAILIVTGVIACIYLWGALRLGLVYHGTPGAGIFPLLSALLVIAMAVLSFLETATRETSTEEPIEDWLRLLIYTGVTLVWALSFSYLGFILSSAVAIFTVSLFGERQSLVRSATITAISIFISWLFFQEILSVPLPAGVLLR